MTNDKLLQIIAAAYQVAGLHDAPAHILDVLANPELATQAQIDAMLPYAPAINIGGEVADAEIDALAEIYATGMDVFERYIVTTADLREIVAAARKPPAQARPDLYREIVEDRAKRGGWKPEDDIGPFEFVLRISYESGLKDAAGINTANAAPPEQAEPATLAQGYFIAEELES